MDSLEINVQSLKVSALKSLEDDAATVESIKELMKQVDEYIPIPTREKVKPFLMGVEDVKTIIGRGTVATDRVERGTINVMKKLKSLELWKLENLSVLHLKCSEKFLIQLYLVIALVLF